MRASSKITEALRRLNETKQVSTLNRPRRDLRSLEATAYRIVHGDKRDKKYSRIVKAQTAVAEEHVERLKAKLRATLTREIKKWQAGQHEWTTLMKRTKEAFTVAYEDAYRLGLVAQGHTEMRKPRGTHLSPTHTLTRDDRLWIKSAVEEEFLYWRNFMRDIRYDRLRMKQGQRLGMYVSTLHSVYDAGRVAGGAEHTIIHWVVGEAEHCPDCLWLAATGPYHKDNLPTTPRSGGTRCLSNCKCKLVFDQISVDMWQKFLRKSPSRKELASQLQRSRRLKLGLPSKRMRKVKTHANRSK